MNQCAVRDALAPVISNIVGVYDSIVSWRRSNGDLFYSVQSNDLVVRRYGHESHDFPETAKSGRISRLKSQLTDFLWQIGEGKKIEELFSLFTTPSKQDAQPPNPSKTCVKTVIHLRELIFHSTSCGFAEVIAVPKEEWFALFRGMQELSPPNCAGITFSAFRTFLVDPFHQFFWKQYVHQIREQANSNRELINRALLESFEASKGLTHGGHRSNNEADSTDGIIEETFMGNGRISIQTFRDTLLHALDDIDAATNEFDFTKSRTSKPSHALNGKRPLKVAIATGHRRPDLELFTSSEAVHKLFAARANIRPDNSTRTKTTSTSTNVVTALRASANTHLARIRNLPISHLLREGVNFRPSRRDLYHCDDEKGSTQAEAMGAEESY
ncbi:hypothetical protein PF002_g10213 [Phytophthora fragariae]|uniref:Uncharacterized protein n=1 Tax=Phytophthora fragariae TaxID=53985 RepID=A0A6A3ZRT5_9STRA|nr:hypothetical protein PF002_g10213 [Phytophthora fragariae]KAE9314311.1 hypothetical protein PF001_g8334 [Phytophthora fragariae]